MGFSCSAVSGYFSSRPPVSIFIFSMLSLSLALLGLAGYCHYRPDLQAEVLDWSRLLQEMSELSYCLGNSSQSQVIAAPEMTASLAGVPVLGEGDFTSGGTLPLSLLGLDSPHNVTISLQVRAGQACVRVQAETDLLSHLRNESLGETPCWQEESQLSTWTAHRPRHLPHNWCDLPGHSQARIKFGSIPGLETFLSQEQRDVIYYHLVTTSLLLIVVCVVLVVWAGLRRDTTDSLTLLPTSDSEDM